MAGHTIGRILGSAAFALMLLGEGLFAQEFNTVPGDWKWVSPREVAFTYDSSYKGEKDYVIDAVTMKRRGGISYPRRYDKFPVEPEGAVNLTYSPDSTSLAFTRDNDLYVVDIASGKERRLTFDGTDLILNGYASWVYYEEILGRPSRYRAFWWSPDSRKIAFYRFDNTAVPVFPIYSPKGLTGSLNLTRYPKVGQDNPKVRIGFVDLDGEGDTPKVTWADFDENEDQYFGTPFWGADSREFFVSREPRIQNTLDLYAVSPRDGSKRFVYHESYKTWLDWIDGMLFGEKGLYMSRAFETGWQQIYYLPYDGSPVRRLSDGTNWRVNLLRVDEKKGEVYFLANRDSGVRTGLYKTDGKGGVVALSDPAYNVNRVVFSPDGKYFTMTISNFTTPPRTYLLESAHAPKVAPSLKEGKYCHLLFDQATSEFNPDNHSLPRNISIETPDGLTLPGFIVYPKGFDPERKYPVHVDLYGGPDTPQVRDSWRGVGAYEWYSQNGIIEVVADCRAGGQNGRRGLDDIYCKLDVKEIEDFVLWGKYLQSLPYVNPDKIGVEGFSFGGTMTSLLVMDHSDVFHYGIAGGGVYDWRLYDTHYTERFMETPATNEEGYAVTRVIDHAVNYPTTYENSTPGKVEPVMLKLTHGTGDDNVHFQNTLQLIDALHKEGKKFEFMIYPDGMHGYRGYQGQHFQKANREFWLKYLLSE